jgi:hypothetical protein
MDGSANHWESFKVALGKVEAGKAIIDALEKHE